MSSFLLIRLHYFFKSEDTCLYGLTQPGALGSDVLWNLGKFQSLEKSPGMYTMCYVTPLVGSVVVPHNQTADCFCVEVFEHSPPSGRNRFSPAQVRLGWQMS